MNGLKKPNIYGRDVFIFRIANGKGATIYPVGGREDSYWKNYSTGTISSCDNSPGKKQGGSCAGRIMEEGWEMNY